MSRSTKKRALDSSSETDYTETPLSPRRPFQFSNFSSTTGLEANLDASIYRAELEHERSLRSLDAKRYQQKEHRLEKLVEFSQEELEQCKAILEEERQQSESHMEQLRKARDEALQQLRGFQQSNMFGYDNYNGSPSDENEQFNSIWQRKYDLLQRKMEGKDEELEQLHIQLEALRQQVSQSLRKSEPSTPPPVAPVKGQSSPAPSELMHELNRIRIELAEAERKERQMRRVAEDWQKKAKQLLPEREASRALQIRAQKLEGQLRDVQKDFQLSVAENEAWKNFQRALADHFPEDVLGASKDDVNPPEVATILRHVEKVKKDLAEAEKAKLVLEQRLENFKDWKKPAEARMKLYDDNEAAWKVSVKDLEQRLLLLQTQNQTLLKKEAIWKREISSLQELNQTFDSLPVSNATGTTATLVAASKDSNFQIMKLNLKAAEDELELIKGDHARLQKELDSSVEERQGLRQELDRVKSKYGKLREALELQRGKAEEAEARAHRAEELAGKGSFNPNETRVLHLSQNPLSDTLQKQNAALKKQLQEALEKRGPGEAKVHSGTLPSCQSEVDPDKLHQRLKQSFKEQIGLFREGVHLMTGYKIDMLPGVDRPTFRVRSMYAEREEDHLMLKWPKLSEGEIVSSLDLLGTEWARALAMTPSYDYMTKFNSLPAFLASVQLTQFEKQTMMG